MTLTGTLQPTYQSVFEALEKLGARIVSEAQRDDVAETLIGAIVELMGADRGVLLLLRGGGEVVFAARHQAGAVPVYAQEDLARSLVREVRASGEPRTWDAFGADGEQGSALELGIVAAAAVPLRGAAGEVGGVVYLDVREPGLVLGAMHVRCLSLMAQQLGSVLLPSASRAEAPVSDDADAEAKRPLSLNAMLATPSMASVADALATAQESDLNVLIRGATGTGKTALALALGRHLGRGNVVRATLGSSDDLNTITSELFGHERGAFSGATTRRAGLVEHANGGALILDELLNLPMAAQQLLLDYTQFGTYRPLGYSGKEPKRSTTRIIAVTLGDLEAAMDAGTFRRDLYYRLAGIAVQVPSLSERRGDLPWLAESMLRRDDRARRWALVPSVRRALVGGGRAWEGNVRELEAVVRRARARALVRNPDTDVLTLEDFQNELGAIGEPRLTPTPDGAQASTDDADACWGRAQALRDRAAAEEASALEAALREEKGVVSRVARRFEIPRTTLIHRMQLLGVRTE